MALRGQFDQAELYSPESPFQYVNMGYEEESFMRVGGLKRHSNLVAHSSSSQLFDPTVIYMLLTKRCN